MDITQKFRRLGQKMNSWLNSIDNSDFQMSIINKLYKINGLVIEKTSAACPEQYNIFKNGIQVAYYRLRHGSFTVDVPNCGGETIYYFEPSGEGMFEDNERLVILTKALRKVTKNA